ncbi:hypothetical protein [Myxacorys almedinensis]|uniref:Uncharacterized protein n=1 Tax=Myxacorys almedinensis A TaxID=2690445 RepID=A0A8J8CLE0_9CYAN|nr:hypothetical protein [Myxacorys almedinensis]NDJ19521.1 hypothetical protein [Myxacorys almedinensis A]
MLIGVQSSNEITAPAKASSLIAITFATALSGSDWLAIESGLRVLQLFLGIFLILLALATHTEN